MAYYIAKMITRVTIKGYKSFRDEVSAEIKPLTILAGANSSGKSSLVQPLLLLKQTLSTPSDPGPLRLDGPNVIFSRSEQLFWKAPNDESNRFQIQIDFKKGKLNIRVKNIYGRKKGAKSLQTIKLESTEWIINNNVYKFSSKGGESNEISELQNLITERFPSLKVKIEIKRYRCFMLAEAKSDSLRFGIYPGEHFFAELQIKRIIHVPGLRGNPERTYPVRAVGKDFPGLFQDYVAGLISTWQRSKEDNISKLNDYLRKMGLSWKIRALKRSDTEVELQVGRTQRGLRGGAKDLVNIADVGLGVSQALPVLVALVASGPDQLVYLEQPEIHLHPESQVALADIISESVSNGKKVIVETHSHLMLMAFQKAIAKKIIPAADVVLHWFIRDEKGITKISTTYFNEDGTFKNPEIPVDFADISMNLIKEFIEAI